MIGKKEICLGNDVKEKEKERVSRENSAMNIRVAGQRQQSSALDIILIRLLLQDG